MLLKKSKLYSSLKKFADGTTLHGYKDFYYTKSKVLKLFWAVVLTATLCSTIFHIYKTVLHYHNQPTVITFESVKSGEMVYPDLMLCYPHWVYWVNWRKVTKLGFTKETALYGLSYLTHIYTSTAFDILSTKCNFQQQMRVNNFTKLSQFYYAIAQTKPPRTVSVNHIDSHFLKTNFSLKFLSWPDHRLCYVMSSDRISEITKSDLFGWGVWFGINHSTSFGYTKFVQSEEYREYLRSFLFNADSSLLKPKNEPADRLDYHLPVHLQINENSLDSIAISPDVEKYVIKVKASVRKWKNKKYKPCAEGMVQNGIFDNKCPLKCFADAMHNSCKENCMEFEHAILIDHDNTKTVCSKPIIFLKNTTSGTIKNSSSTSNTTRDSIRLQSTSIITRDFMNSDSSTSNDSCSEYESLPQAKGMCKGLSSFNPGSCKKCIQSCEQWDFERTSTVTRQPKPVRDVAVQGYNIIYVLYPRQESVIVMTEVDSLTYDGMIADVGGLLGIWLGASVVTFVQMIYHCCFDNSDTDDNSVPM